MSFKNNVGTGYLLVGLFCLVLYWQFWFRGLIPAPFDTLVGAYYPWLDYKWGTITGVPVKNALLSDSFSQFYIWKYMATDQLMSRKLPVWNPYVFSGTPLLATFHSAVLFPANIVLFLPRPWSWGLYIFCSTLLSGLSMYLFLGKFTKKKAARIFGSIVFSTAGPMTTWAEFGTAVWAMSFWPLLFLLPMLKLKRLYLISFTFLFSAMILAGNVQVITYFAALFCLWVFFNKFSYKYLWMLVLGILICSIQLVPTFDLYRKSIRGAENYAADFNFGLTPISNFIRLWSADFFGNPVTYNHWLKTISYHEYSSFLGTITVAVVLNYIIFEKNKNRHNIFWTIVFFSSLILLSDNFASRFIFSQPIPLLTYSSASRLLFMTVFSASILSAVGLGKLRSITLVPIILIGITVMALIFVPKEYRFVSIKNSILPLLILTMTIIFSRFKNLGIALLVALNTIDLGRYFLKYNPFVSNAFVFPNTPVIEYLQQNSNGYRFFKQKTNLFPLNTWSAYGLRSPEGYDPLHYKAYHQDFHLLNNKEINNKVSRYAELDDINTDLLEKYSLKFYTGVDGTSDPILKKLLAVGWYKVFSDKSVSIYQNPNPVKIIADKVPDDAINPIKIGTGLSVAGLVTIWVLMSPKTGWWRRELNG